MAETNNLSRVRSPVRGDLSIVLRCTYRERSFLPVELPGAAHHEWRFSQRDSILDQSSSATPPAPALSSLIVMASARSEPYTNSFGWDSVKLSSGIGNGAVEITRPVLIALAVDDPPFHLKLRSSLHIESSGTDRAKIRIVFYEVGHRLEVVSPHGPQMLPSPHDMRQGVI